MEAGRRNTFYKRCGLSHGPARARDFKLGGGTVGSHTMHCKALLPSLPSHAFTECVYPLHLSHPPSAEGLLPLWPPLGRMLGVTLGCPMAALRRAPQNCLV